LPSLGTSETIAIINEWAGARKIAATAREPTTEPAIGIQNRNVCLALFEFRVERATRIAIFSFRASAATRRSKHRDCQNHRQHRSLHRQDFQLAIPRKHFPLLSSHVFESSPLTAAAATVPHGDLTYSSAPPK
jgi:hypothetical protein